MTYIMNINIQADEDILYFLRNKKKCYAILMRQNIQAINHWI